MSSNIMTEKKKYDTNYKKEIVRLVTELGKRPVDVAQDIGVTATSIRRWVKQYVVHGEDAFPGKGNLHTSDAEKKKFEKAIKELEEENSILKKAMAIFSRDTR